MPFTGALDGALEGDADGALEGDADGVFVGCCVGLDEGELVIVAGGMSTLSMV